MWYLQGLIAMATVRLVPAAPFTVVNLAAASLNARFLEFALGTLVGMAPGIFSLVVFGERLEHAIRDPEIRYRPGKEEPPPQASRGW